MNSYKQHPLYRKHTLDTAMSGLWEFYKSHFAPLFLISFIFSVAVNFFSLTVDYDRLMEASMEQDMETIREMMTQMLIMVIPVILITLYAFVFLSLYTLERPVNSTNYLKILAESFKYLLTYTIIFILFIPVIGFSLVIGIIALIIGILFSIIWLTALFAFFAPLLMAEGNDITNAIVRSFRLLHRHFGSNIGWTAVFIVIIFLISLVISGLSMIPFAGSFLQTMANPDEVTNILEVAKNPVFILFSSALNALIMPLFPIFSFILYFNAKAWEDDRLDDMIE
ncbi:MAG: hypothetical protein R6W67_03810 [Bacteroidales bacterium]